MTRWRRLGRVFAPNGQRPWTQSHCQNPVTLQLGDSVHRVYFASRDSDNRAYISSVDLDVSGPPYEAEPAERYALDPGPLGNFDDFGVYPASIVTEGDRHHLYYIGVNPGKASPLFYASIGVAVSDDGGRTFQRERMAPVLDRSEFDPCLVTGPAILVEDGLWRMWYVSGFRWEHKSDGSLTSWYHVKYAESDDGIDWRRDGRVCIDHVHPGERNIARPCVLRDGDGYVAWYSYAGDFDYTVGRAVSADGLEWERIDDVEFEPEAEDWESESQAYPWVFEDSGRRYMVYSGNEIGREGFGLAVLDEDQ